MKTTRTDSIVRSVPGDRFTPFSLARKLGAKAILESASFAHGKARFSILLATEAFRVRQDSDGVSLVAGSVATRLPARDILDALSSIASQNPVPDDGIPLPGAGIGYLGYEFASRCDTIRLAAQPDSIGIPEAEFIVGHVYVVFDHFTDTIHLFGLNYDEHQIDLDQALSDILRRMDDLDFSHMAAPSEAEIGPCTTISDQHSDKAIFIRSVNQIKAHILEGDLLQAVVSRRLILRSAQSALEAYRRLRSKSPSPYLVYLDYGTHQIVGASPESLVRVRGSVVSIRPIAGTRRRGKDAHEDAALRQELLDDPKERAEHLMLVDLARNDLGRVSVPGSVRTTRFMEVESFSHVMHIVSDVVGQLDSTAKTVAGIDALRAAFPAGTVSGAPKIKAMEILSTLESERRSFYAGAVGYLQSDGSLDFCIAIRTALKQGDRWVLQSGAGIVHASDPEREWEETNEKLQAMRLVLGSDQGERQ